MQPSKILNSYRYECESDNFNKIHKDYSVELMALIKKYTPKNYLTKPLIVIAALLIIPIVLMIISEEDYTFTIVFFVLLVIALLVLSGVINWVIEEIGYKRMNSKKYLKELSELNWKYYEEKGSVIGYYNNFKCGDYDETEEQAYCSFTGKPISYSKYCNCQKGGSFNRCPYYSEFLKTL